MLCNGSRLCIPAILAAAAAAATTTAGEEEDVRDTGDNVEQDGGKSGNAAAGTRSYYVYALTYACTNIKR